MCIYLVYVRVFNCGNLFILADGTLADGISCDATVAMILPTYSRASRESFTHEGDKLFCCRLYSNKRFTEEHKITYYVTVSVFYCDL